MTVYWQHVGEKGGSRDFPRTIGSPKAGLVRFAFEDISPFLNHLDTSEVSEIERDLRRYAQDGFQIWGIPAGAKSVLRQLSVGDHLLLLETPGPGGQFVYGGVVVGRPSMECHDLSKHLWGEQRFPLIVFLRGGLTSYRWYDFCDRLGYKRNWNPAGNTYRLPRDKIQASPYADENTLIRQLVGVSLPLEPTHQIEDRQFVDDAELYIESAEGREELRRHIHRERSSNLVSEFKRRLSNFSCSICGFNFEMAYGELGRKFIEAHHVNPVSAMRDGDRTRLSDLIPVCSNCHRMLHRTSPVGTAEDLKEKLRSAYESRDE
jgi:5-methylcytosine-specific restriction protein A